MFVNLETTVLSELVKAGARENWIAVTSAFLHFHERDAALAKLAEAIRWYVREQATHSDSVTADFYRHAITRVDFFSIARDLIDAAGATGQSLDETYRLPDKECITA